MHHDGITLVFLSKGKVAIIDSADAERVLAHRWFVMNDRAGKLGYATRNETIGYRRQRPVFLHWFLCGEIPPGHEVDHANHNTLDNRICNLRICTKAQNQANHQGRRHNTSGYAGVSWNKRSRKWVAQVIENGRRKGLGYFATAEDAARARDAFVLRLYGEFAFLNFNHDNASWDIECKCRVQIR